MTAKLAPSPLAGVPVERLTAEIERWYQTCFSLLALDGCFPRTIGGV